MEKDWRFSHFCILTRDIDRAVEYYESCGIGPFEPEVVTGTDYELYGKTPTTPIKNRVRVVKMDPIPIIFEFVEPTEGESIHKEWLDKHGEGVNHIAFMVDDLEKETAKLVEKGFTVAMSYEGSDVIPAFAYFDTLKFGNQYLQLMQAPKG